MRSKHIASPRFIHVNAGEEGNENLHKQAFNSKNVVEGHTQCCTCDPKRTKFATNYVSTTKYNMFTFIFVNLFEQFQKKANFYFLIVAIISTTPLSPKTPIVSIAPLVFVLGVTAVKDAIEDYQRYKMDKAINGTMVQVWSPADAAFVRIKWRDLKVGAFVRINCDESFPADIVMLKSSSTSGSCHIETANLDGETNLKSKQAVPETYKIRCDSEGKDYKAGIPPCVLTSSPPNPRLDNSATAWSANLTWINAVSDDKVPLGMDQLLLRGCTLRNTKWVLGYVVFTGIETKVIMNNSPAKFKRSNLDRYVDKALYVLFGIQIVLCTLGSMANYLWLNANSDKHWYLPYRYESNPNLGGEAALSWFTFLVLLDILIPISLYVSMELVKLVQALYIFFDLDMYHEEVNKRAQARTSSLNEELGQVSYIFSDKTGTLTRNIMDFLCCSINGVVFGFDTKTGKALDQKEEKKEESVSETFVGIPPPDASFSFKDPSLMKALNTLVPNQILSHHIDEFLSLLATCHSALPDFPKCKEDHFHSPETCNTPVEYQAASPDEAALCRAAKNLNYYCYHREPATLKFGSHCEHELNGERLFINSRGVKYNAELLEVFKFTSTRARMSVIFRDSRTKKIKIYTKGADNKMFPLLTKKSINDLWEKTQAHLVHFAKLGLRSLIVAYREVEEEEFIQWYENHKRAKAATVNRDELVDASYDVIEKNLILIGATAIEDKLQDGVPEAIASLAKGGIKIWMLTGDKMETAINIGRSCKLLTPIMEKRGIMELEVDERLSDAQAKERTLAYLEDFWKKVESDPFLSENAALVIAGRALSFVFPAPMLGKKAKTGGTPEEIRLQKLFLLTCQKCKAVICCRVSPAQKAQVVKLVRGGVPNAITLAIGDGANDVSMIKAAHVGIGISGMEGLQAVMASDYAISQFKYLETLCFKHGAWSYRRMSALILFSFYKNVTISMTQIWFAFYSGFSAQMFYDAYAGSAYNIVFTSFPVLLLAVFNRDVSKQGLIAYPQLYLVGPQNKYFSIKLLFMVIANALFQSICLFFIPMYSINPSPESNGQMSDQWSISTTMYSCLVLVVTFKVSLDTTTFVKFTWILLAVSLVLWFTFQAVYTIIIIDGSAITPDMYYVGVRIFTLPTYWLNMLLLPVVCLMPEIVTKYYMRTYHPTLMDIVREQEKGYQPSASKEIA